MTTIRLFGALAVAAALGAGQQGVGFAYPLEGPSGPEHSILADAPDFHGRIGVTLQDVDAALGEAFGLDRPRGALVSAVEPRSPAEKGGLQPGDIILAYDLKPIERAAELPGVVADIPAGHSAVVEVWRAGAPRTAVISMDTAQEEGTIAGEPVVLAPAWLGLAVRPLTLGERLANDGRGGLVVEQVVGPAARAGILPGDIVLQMNGTPVASARELRELLAGARTAAAMLVQREHLQLFVPVDLGSETDGTDYPGSAGGWPEYWPE